jgi:hypothetical protein
MSEVVPIQVEQFLQTKLKVGLSPKTTRNLLGILQGIFSLAVDNDLIARSPMRNRHKPTVRRIEKPIWSPVQMREILENTPERFRVCFQVLALTGSQDGRSIRPAMEACRFGESAVADRTELLARPTRGTKDEVQCSHNYECGACRSTHETSGGVGYESIQRFCILQEGWFAIAPGCASEGRALPGP